MKNYIAYCNPWTEGVVVVRKDDLSFAVGYDGCSGNVCYSDNLNEVLEKSSIIFESNYIEEIVKHDSALYSRYPLDPIEGELYTDIRKIHLEEGYKEFSEEMDIKFN